MVFEPGEAEEYSKRLDLRKLGSEKQYDLQFVIIRKEGKTNLYNRKISAIEKPTILY